jgi:ribosomal protein L32
MDPTHDSYMGNGHNSTRRGQEREGGEEEMVEEVITNILGETMIVMKPKKRKKKDRTKRSHYNHQMVDVDEEQSHSHLHQPAHIPSKNAEEEGSDDGKDELQRLVDSYFETSEETPKMDPDSFVPGAELFVEDDPSVFSAMTMPTVFADDGTVISRLTRSHRTTVGKSEEGEKNMPVIRERTSANSGSHSGSHRSVASHQLREPPTESEDYLQSADKLSPDIDAVRDIVKDCMQINSDEQAIEVVRQALMGTESLALALFCLTTLWVLVRK